MWYWIVMIMLAIGSIIMLAVSFAGIKRRNDMAVNVRPQGRGYGDDELSRQGESGPPPQKSQKTVENHIGRY